MRDDIQPPRSTPIEEALLGGLLMHNPLWHQVAEIVKPEDFYDPALRVIAQTMWTSFEAGNTVTPMSLEVNLPTGFQVDRDTSVRVYLVRLLTEAISLTHLTNYAKIVAAYAHRRQLMSVLYDAYEKAATVPAETHLVELLEGLEDGVFEVEKLAPNKSVRFLHEAAADAVAWATKAKKAGGKLGFATGIPQVDAMLGPMLAGDVVSIVAPSGAGKTAFVTQMLLNVVTQDDLNRPALLIEMEMTSVGIAQRTLAHYGGPTVQAQKAGKLSNDDLERLTSEAVGLQQVPVLIDDSGSLTARKIRHRIRQAKRQYDISVVAIDHLQLTQLEKWHRKDIDMIRDFCAEMKAIAKESGVLLVILSQLTRGSQEALKHWRFTDQAIYGGDFLKQASDIVIGLANPSDHLAHKLATMDERGVEHRHNVEANLEAWRGHAEIGGLKLRDGDKGRWLKIPFSGGRQTFGDLSLGTGIALRPSASSTASSLPLFAAPSDPLFEDTGADDGFGWSGSPE